MDLMMKKILVYLRNVFNVFIAGYAISIYAFTCGFL